MRTSDAKKLDPMFLERWSPRAFLPDPVTDDDRAAIFEAARWSPSCFNEQPWRFVYAQSEEDRARFVEALTPGNQIWAKDAPLLMFAFGKRRFDHNDKDNRWAAFDSGAAWMALTLQANKLGYVTHGMGGYDADKAYDVCGVDTEDYQVICAIAVGKQGPAEQLPEDVASKESPSGRSPVGDFAFEGKMKA